jgi:hypothetical protein
MRGYLASSLMMYIDPRSGYDVGDGGVSAAASQRLPPWGVSFAVGLLCLAAASPPGTDVVSVLSAVENGLCINSAEM